MGRGCVGWVNQGPFHVVDPGATENVPNSTVIGAVSALVLRGDVAFIGTTNGGVWRTENIHAAPERLHWSPMFDHQTNVSCTSIAALAQDADAPQRLVAGCGLASSWLSQFDELNGLVQSLDAGLTWQPLSAFPRDLGVASIALRAPSVITVAVKLQVLYGTQPAPASKQRGVWRSADGGASWAKIALPGVAIDDTTARSAALRLAADPNDSSFLVVATAAGAFVSRDAGATFVAASSGLLVTVNTSTVSRADNAVIAIASRTAAGGGPLTRVIWLGFAACPDFGADGCAFAIYRSIDDGASWVSMTEPGTIEPSRGGKFFGLGDQGFIHFAMAADPEGVCAMARFRCMCCSASTDTYHIFFSCSLALILFSRADFSIVYVGGSTQYVLGPDSALGAQAYSGRLFRGNFSVSTSPFANPVAQWAPLTHTGTAHRSSPHADSRTLTWDPALSGGAGGLLHTCDGGVYIRTRPRGNAGDWFSHNGDLGISEYVSAAYNTRSGVLSAGAQDNGSFLSSLNSKISPTSDYGALIGANVNGGDGGFTLADAARDRLYVTSQFLGLVVVNSAGTIGYEFDRAGTLVDEVRAPFSPQLVLNAATPDSSPVGRVLTCVSAPNPGCYELTTLGPGRDSVKSVTTSFYDVHAYGGARNGVADESVFLGVSSVFVFARTSSSAPAPKPIAAPFAWGSCRALAANPIDYFEALIVCNNLFGTGVYLTRDFGATWRNVTGDLLAVSGVRVAAKAEAALIVPLSDGDRAYLVWR
jgi:hypothetical protein